MNYYGSDTMITFLLYDRKIHFEIYTLDLTHAVSGFIKMNSMKKKNMTKYYQLCIRKILRNFFFF